MLKVSASEHVGFPLGSVVSLCQQQQQQSEPELCVVRPAVITSGIIIMKLLKKKTYWKNPVWLFSSDEIQKSFELKKTK